MPAQTERYLDLARLGRNEWWRYALGIFIIAFSWLVLGYAPYLVLVAATGVQTGSLPVFVAVNFSIFMMLAGLAVTVKFVHRRPLLSLIAPDTQVDWRRIGRGALVWAALAAVTAVIEHFLFPERYYLSYDPERFFGFLAVVLMLTPIQCATEELVFRGYVTQGLGLLTRRPAMIAAGSSIVFTVPHLMNPELAQYGALLMAANYFAIGMLLATVTLRDGRLELAIGLHAVNNVFLGLVANYEGSVLATEAVFTAQEFDPVYSLATLIVGAIVFHWWIFGRVARGPEMGGAGRC
jgi:membrane protease YdiL (CAAX protease family)